MKVKFDSLGSATLRRIAIAALALAALVVPATAVAAAEQILIPIVMSPRPGSSTTLHGAAVHGIGVENGFVRIAEASTASACSPVVARWALVPLRGPEPADRHPAALRPALELALLDREVVALARSSPTTPGRRNGFFALEIERAAFISADAGRIRAEPLQQRRPSRTRPPCRTRGTRRSGSRPSRTSRGARGTASSPDRSSSAGRSDP